MILKRFFDILVSFTCVVLLAPLYLVIGILILTSMGRPILFKQRRPGLNGKPFNMYKFRTMKNQFAANGELLPDEQRMTAVGTFLRKSSLDELAEIFNVLRGDMSIVGPRPLLMEYLELYSPSQMRRHEVRPGITGLAQISGRNELDWDERFKLDVWYVDNYSFLLDLKIIFKTFFKVVRAEGVTQKGHVTVEKFRGSGKNSK